MIPIEEARTHLGLEQDEQDFDSKITQLLPAAVAAVKNYLNRPLFETKSDLESAIEAGTDDGMGIALEGNDDIKIGILMFLTHFIDHPSISSELTIKEVPAISYLLDAHRLINV